MADIHEQFERWSDMFRREREKVESLRAELAAAKAETEAERRQAQKWLAASRSVTDGTMDELGAALAELAAARERERELEDVVRFLAGAVSEAYAARNEAMGMDAEECKEHLIMRFPTIQTTRALFAVDRIAAQPYRKGVAGRALIRLAAPTSAAHTGEGGEHGRK